MVDGKVRYYLTSAERSSGKPTGRAVKLLKGKQTNVFLGTSKADMFHHPTKKAHAEIFLHWRRRRRTSILRSGISTKGRT